VTVFVVFAFTVAVLVPLSVSTAFLPMPAWTSAEPLIFASAAAPLAAIRPMLIGSESTVEWLTPSAWTVKSPPPVTEPS
jgi:hypothetical protein